MTSPGTLNELSFAGEPVRRPPERPGRRRAIHEPPGAGEAAGGSVAGERGACDGGGDRGHLAREAEACASGHGAAADRQWSAEAPRETRRGAEAALRRGGYPEPRLDGLAHLAADAARRTPP